MKTNRNRLQAFGRSLGGSLAFLAAGAGVLGAAPADALNRNSASVTEEVVYQGCCDASAVITVQTNFFILASDEDSRLRMYDRNQGGLPVQTFDLRPHLNLGTGPAETDIEGAARVGERVYWITSHARNKDGKERPNRHRFFATGFSMTNGSAKMTFVGRPYESLLADLVAAPQLASFNLLAASRRAPKEANAFNIESLSATPDGGLLIGFRNPVPAQKALLVPLRNPAEVVQGKRPQLGEPRLLDLGGLGIRDMVYHEGRYVIVAGVAQGGGREKLFAWEGGSDRPKPFKSVKLKDYNPESIAVYADKGFSGFQLLSDDSSQRVGQLECSEITNPAARRFRAVWITHETE